MPNGSFAFQLLILGERIFFDHKSKGITKDSLDVGEQPWEVPGVNWRCCRCFKDFQSKVMSSHCWFEFVFSTKRWSYEWYLPAQQGREMNRVSCFKEGDSCFKGRRMYTYIGLGCLLLITVEPQKYQGWPLLRRSCGYKISTSHVQRLIF